MPHRFLSQMEVQIVAPGTPIIQKGEKNPYIYMLCAGSIRIINVFDHNRMLSFATKESPGFSGLLEFLSGEEIATSTVETATQCSFLRIRKQIFALWMDEDIAAFRMVVRAFARQLYPSLDSFGSYYFYPKYYVLVQYLSRRYGSGAETSGEATVPASRESIAEELGFSLRTMYRLSSRLAEDGFVHVRSKKFTITRDGAVKMRKYLENEHHAQKA